MHLIFCLDDRNGMLFNSRRQSKDRFLRENLLQMVGTGKLWMNGYSAKQFAEATQTICVDEDFLSKAGDEDYCFVENADFIQHLKNARKLIIYRWNRVYPFDVQFPQEALSQRTRISEQDFPGYSHQRITQEVYI